MKHIVIFFGPTGVGKSNLAELVAKKVPAEIVNMDMGQLYAPISIGTAKPDWRSSAIQHHLFDYIKEPRNFSVVDYRNALIPIVNDIWDRNKLPFLVGGSAFYLKSLFFPPSVPFIGAGNYQVTWDDLHAVDPARASSIHKNDAYRIHRAMNIWLSTGKKPSDYTTMYDPLSTYDLLFITRERAELNMLINNRVHSMFNQGWINEVISLKGTPWEAFLREKKLIGYDDIFDYLDNNGAEHDLNSIITRIQQKTRQYAKRQCTFWRMLQKKLEIHINQAQQASSIAVINLTFIDLDLYINQLSQRLQRLLK